MTRSTTTAQALFDSSQGFIEREFENGRKKPLPRLWTQAWLRKPSSRSTFILNAVATSLQNKQYTDALMQFNQALELRPDDPVLTETANSTKTPVERKCAHWQDARQKFRWVIIPDALQGA